MHLDVDSKLNLTSADLIGSRVAVLGVSGSGKSMTARVLIEELLPSVPMTLVDIEGELWSLKEQFDILHVGGNFRAEPDLVVAPDDAGALAAWVWQNNVSVILDMSEFEKDRDQFLLAYFEALWTAANTNPKPHTVLIEEVHEFVPEDGMSPLKELFTRYAKRGRKRGIGMIFVSQRSAEVSKALLTQASYFFLHRVTYPTDMSVYTKLLPMLPPKQVPTQVSALKSGDCLAVRDGVVEQVRIRMSQTHHVGATPTGEQTEIALKHIDAAMLEQLRGALGTVATPDETQEVADLRTRLATALRERDEARDQLRQLQQEIERMRIDATARTLAAMKEQRQPEKFIEQVPKPVTESHLSTLALTRRQNAQERRFVVLLDKIEHFRPVFREVLFQLGTDAKKKWTIRQLAEGLDYSEDQVGRACRALLDLQVARRDNPQCYQSNLAALFNRDYADLDHNQLQDRLLKIAIPQKKLAGA